MFESFRDFVLGTDVGIHGKIGGSGPPLLMLHGYPQNYYEWARVAPILANDYTVVCTDLRGYGASEKPDSDLKAYSFRAMANDQAEVMQQLGFERFHVVGHDRGARTAYRLALDHEARILSLSLLDIVPTLEMFANTSAGFARTYWHWFFLQLPHPFPERLIERNPQHFYEGSLFALGKTDPGEFSEDQLRAYRDSWRDPDFVRGTCADYRAAASVDIELDRQDKDRVLQCPSLILWGSKSTLPQYFDIESVWRSKLAAPKFASLPAGHFFVDQQPDETARVISEFLAQSEERHRKG